MADNPVEIQFIPGTNRLGWDAMRVVHKENGRILKTWSLSRDKNLVIYMFVDADPEKWDVVTDPDEVRRYSAWFDQYDYFKAVSDSLSGPRA